MPYWHAPATVSCVHAKWISTAMYPLCVNNTILWLQHVAATCLCVMTPHVREALFKKYINMYLWNPLIKPWPLLERKRSLFWVFLVESEQFISWQRNVLEITHSELMQLYGATFEKSVDIWVRINILKVQGLKNSRSCRQDLENSASCQQNPKTILLP